MLPRGLAGAHAGLLSMTAVVRRVALVAMVLVVAAAGCSKKTGTRGAGSGTGKAAPAAPPIKASDVQALLYRCEGRAQAGDVKGFRDCLTAASVKRLDQALGGARGRLQRAVLEADAVLRRALALAPDRRAKIAPQLAALKAQRMRLAAMHAQVNWKVHLAAIAKSPRSQVLSLEQRGLHAKFKKRVVGKGKPRETWHTLAFDRGHWRVDLVGNPEFGRRLHAMDVAVRRGVLAVQAAAKTLVAAMDRATGGGKPAAKGKPKPKAKSKPKAKR